MSLEIYNKYVQLDTASPTGLTALTAFNDVRGARYYKGAPVGILNEEWGTYEVQFPEMESAHPKQVHQVIVHMYYNREPLRVKHIDGNKQNNSISNLKPTYRLTHDEKELKEFQRKIEHEERSRQDVLLAKRALRKGKRRKVW